MGAKALFEHEFKIIDLFREFIIRGIGDCTMAASLYCKYIREILLANER